MTRKVKVKRQLLILVLFPEPRNWINWSLDTENFIPTFFTAFGIIRLFNFVGKMPSTGTSQSSREEKFLNDVLTIFIRLPVEAQHLLPTSASPGHLRAKEFTAPPQTFLASGPNTVHWARSTLQLKIGLQTQPVREVSIHILFWERVFWDNCLQYSRKYFAIKANRHGTEREIQIHLDRWQYSVCLFLWVVQESFPVDKMLENILFMCTEIMLKWCLNVVEAVLSLTIPISIFSFFPSIYHWAAYKYNWYNSMVTHRNNTCIIFTHRKICLFLKIVFIYLRRTEKEREKKGARAGSWSEPKWDA